MSFDGYLTSATRIMDRGQNANSYKFALLRTLAAYGLEYGSAVIGDLPFLGERTRKK